MEKKITMEDAFKVWWFIMWRSVLSTVIVLIIFYFIKTTEAIKPIINAIGYIVSIIIPVYFIKKAINRNYANFRLSANLLDNNKQNEQESTK